MGTTRQKERWSTKGDEGEQSKESLWRKGKDPNQRQHGLLNM